MKRMLAFFSCLLLAGTLCGEETAIKTTKTTTVVTETKTVKTTVTRPALKVAVMDFTTADTIAAKLLDNIPAANAKDEKALPTEDKNIVDSVINGLGKLLEEAGKASAEETKWKEQKELLMQTLKGKSRPSILGAEYLSAYLGKYKEVFGCMDAGLVKQAMLKLQKEEDFPKDFFPKLAKETGVSYLIYGTVSDIRSKENAFKGYGIETKTTLCQLDIIIKVVDLAAQHTIFSNVYTGSYKEQRPISVEQFDNNIYQNLMTSALEQAAEELYEECRPDNPDGLFKVKDED